LQLQRDHPLTPKKPVSESYHGQIVVDDYRWLEDPTDPKVKDWVSEQNEFSRSYLDNIPFRDALSSRVKELYSKTSAIYSGLKFKGDFIFFVKWVPTKQQPFLVRIKSNDINSETVVLDPNESDRTFSTSIDFFSPSNDGKLVAISLSKGGSEAGSVHIFDENGKALDDVLLRVNYPTAGGSVAWNRDSSGFYYTRYPREGERPKEDLNFYQQVYFHKLGTDQSKDTYVIGKEFPKIAEIELESSEESNCLLINVRNGDGGEHSHYCLFPSGEWTQITNFKDEIKSATLSRDGLTLFMLSTKDAPKGEILSVSLQSNVKLGSAKNLIKAREGSIETFEVTDSKIYVVEVVGGPSKTFVYDLQGNFETDVPSEPVSAVDEISGLEKDKIFLKSESFINPPAWYEFDPISEELKKTRLATTPPADLSSFEVVREFALSKDGTKIPVSIVRKKGTKLEGQNPLLLYAYGGYGISMTPYFSLRSIVWLEHGGVYAIANIRGGGEYGEEWHKQGMLTRKQNVFDDFIACAEHLVKIGYTNPKKLAIEGGSNGGLLMGAVLTQRPDLFQAVASHVGVYDMLRVELDDNGAFNVTEYGQTKDPEQFKALFAYSPYHRAVEGRRYPATLLLTGENDGRVNPAHSRKMTAKLQTGSNLVLLRTNSAGHGFGTALDERIAMDTDVFSFLFTQLGMKA
jgi:prolyl oligopeptidase